MSEGINWLEVIGLLLVIAGLWFAMFKTLLNKIDKGDEDNRAERSEQIGELHTRINEVRENFVRRDDLASHIQRIENGMAEIRSDLKEHAKLSRNYASEMNSRVDDILTSIATLSATISRSREEKPGR